MPINQCWLPRVYLLWVNSILTQLWYSVSHVVCVCVCICVCVLVAQSCPTLCDLMVYSLPGFSVHGILQARILEWDTISFSREPSWPRDWIRTSCIAGGFFTVWATREALYLPYQGRILEYCQILFSHGERHLNLSHLFPELFCFTVGSLMFGLTS